MLVHKTSDFLSPHTVWCFLQIHCNIVLTLCLTGIGPVLGLLFTPLIGSASDNCSSSYGRRRPFIWLLSLGVLLALIIIPHADLLAARLAWGGHTFQVGHMLFVCEFGLMARFPSLFHLQIGKG